jgi:hypothetical protein
MIGQPAQYRIPAPAPARDGSRLAPRQPDELLPRQCTRCGAVGTHYLTCPSLRLPSGYRLRDDPESTPYK